MRAYFVAVTMLIAAAACGGKAVIDPEAGGGGGGSGGGGTTTTTTTTTGGPAGNIELQSAIMSANCQPAVPADPMNMTIVLYVDNTAGTTALQVSVTGARIEGPAGETAFAVAVQGTDIVNAGTDKELTFSKIPDSATGTHPCSWCNQLEGELILDVVAGGAPVTVTGPVDTFSCVF